MDCLRASCREAGRVLETLPGATPILDAKDATAFGMHRKDRVTIRSGQNALRAHRPSADAGTRRVVAAYGTTPIFTEPRGGHWPRLYAALWPEIERPAARMRTMTGDRGDPPDDRPNLRTHSLGFHARLFGDRARMGFGNPQIADSGDLDARA
jgi:hypothetical protein